MIVTVWHRLSESKTWEHNHISDGYIESVNKPTPTNETQKRNWASAKWRKYQAYLIENKNANPTVISRGKLMSMNKFVYGKWYIIASFHKPAIGVTIGTCFRDKRMITYYRNSFIKYNDGVVIIFGWLGVAIEYWKY